MENIFIILRKEEVMSDRVIIYGLSGWPYTIEARKAYKKHEFYSVIKDQRKLAEMLKISNGKRQVPVIVEGDKVNIGFGGTWCFWFSGRVCWEESSITTKTDFKICNGSAN